MPPAVHLLQVYLVEDSPVIRRSLVAALQELAPVRVLGHAADQAAALQWLQREGCRVDLLIVDLFLAAGSGLGLLQAVRGLPGMRHRVVLSNFATQDMRRRCAALGAHRVFDKSTEIDALLAYCRSLAQPAPAQPTAP
jgi:DNA-binding NarL/FixJ family response regulator